MRRSYAVLGALALLVYGLLLAHHARGFASGADNSGYLNAARLLRAAKLREELRKPPELAQVPLRPWLFTPLGFRPTEDGKSLIPVYPVGLAAQQAALSSLCPSLEDAAVLLNLLAGVGFAFLAYRLGRLLRLKRPLAFLAALLLAANPLSLRFFTWNMSDGPAAFWALACLYFARKGQKKAGYSLAAGLAFALGVATRPTNILLLPALAFALPLRLPHLSGMALGAAPVFVLLGWYNTLQFGAWYRSGYSNLLGEFKLRYIWPTCQHYFLWLARFFSPAFWLLWLAHLRQLWHRQREQLFLGAWWLPFFLFYGFYKYTDDTWWYLRFVLPALPGLLFALLLTAQELASQWKTAWLRRAFASLGFLALGSCLFWSVRLRPLALAEGEKIYPQGVRWAEEMAEGGVFCGQLSGAIYFYSSLPVLRIDLMNQKELVVLLQTLQASGRQARAVLFPFEARVYPRVFPNVLQKIAEKEGLSLWQLSLPETPPANSVPQHERLRPF